MTHVTIWDDEQLSDMPIYEGQATHVWQRLIPGVYDAVGSPHGVDDPNQQQGRVIITSTASRFEPAPYTTEYVTVTTGDLLCLCGNRPDADGWEMCQADGQLCDGADDQWTGHYVCADCGRIVRPNYLLADGCLIDGPVLVLARITRHSEEEVSRYGLDLAAAVEEQS